MACLVTALCRWTCQVAHWITSKTDKSRWSCSQEILLSFFWGKCLAKVYTNQRCLTWNGGGGVSTYRWKDQEQMCKKRSKKKWQADTNWDTVAACFQTITERVALFIHSGWRPPSLPESIKSSNLINSSLWHHRELISRTEYISTYLLKSGSSKRMFLFLMSSQTG